MRLESSAQRPPGWLTRTAMKHTPEGPDQSAGAAATCKSQRGVPTAPHPPRAEAEQDEGGCIPMAPGATEQTSGQPRGRPLAPATAAGWRRPSAEMLEESQFAQSLLHAEAEEQGRQQQAGDDEKKLKYRRVLAEVRRARGRLESRARRTGGRTNRHRRRSVHGVRSRSRRGRSPPSRDTRPVRSDRSRGQAADVEAQSRWPTSSGTNAFGAARNRCQ